MKIEQIAIASQESFERVGIMLPSLLRCFDFEPVARRQVYDRGKDGLPPSDFVFGVYAFEGTFNVVTLHPDNASDLKLFTFNPCHVGLQLLRIFTKSAAALQFCKAAVEVSVNGSFSRPVEYKCEGSKQGEGCCGDLYSDADVAIKPDGNCAAGENDQPHEKAIVARQNSFPPQMVAAFDCENKREIPIAVGGYCFGVGFGGGALIGAPSLRGTEFVSSAAHNKRFLLVMFFPSCVINGIGGRVFGAPARNLNMFNAVVQFGRAG